MNEQLQVTQDDGSTPGDVFPEFAISLEEAGARIRTFQQYVHEHMVEGEDYGIIPGTTKPTLFKPGAEKLNAIFGYAPRVEITNRAEDWDKGFVSYEAKVTLINKRSNSIEAEGLGSCNSRERRYARQDAAGIANTVLKMAKKRALIDATLSATRASGLFTQDLEDMPGEEEAAPAPPPQRQSAPRASQNGTSQNGAQREYSRPANRQSNANKNGYRNGNGQREGGERASGERASYNPERMQGQATTPQINAIFAIASELWGEKAQERIAEQIQGQDIHTITKGEASRLIDTLRMK